MRNSRKTKCTSFITLQLKAQRYQETQRRQRLITRQRNQHDGPLEEKSGTRVLEVAQHDQEQARRPAELRVAVGGPEQGDPDAEQELCE